MVQRTQGARTAAVVLVLLLVAALLVPLVSAGAAEEVADPSPVDTDDPSRPHRVLPFPISDTHPYAEATCFLEPLGGTFNDFCPGPDQGSFGAVQVTRPSEGLCLLDDLLAAVVRNVALGADHYLGAFDPQGVPFPANEFHADAVEESCATAGDAPNALRAHIATGIEGADTVEQGLLEQSSASLPDGRGGLLLRYPDGDGWSTRDLTVKGNDYVGVDDKPLWDFIGPQVPGRTFGGDWVRPLDIAFGVPTGPPTATESPQRSTSTNGSGQLIHEWELAGHALPGICNPSVAVYTEPHRDDDGDPSTPVFDDDGVPGHDPRRQWPWNYSRMVHCLYAVDHSSSTSIVFNRKTIDSTPDALGGRYDLEFSPRFAWVPESWRDLPSYLSGSSRVWEVKRFRAVFLNDVAWSLPGGDYCIYRVHEELIRLPNFVEPDPCADESLVLRSLNALMFDTSTDTENQTMLPDSMEYPWEPSTDVYVTASAPTDAVAGAEVVLGLSFGVTPTGPVAAEDTWVRTELPDSMPLVGMDTSVGEDAGECFAPAVGAFGVLGCAAWDVIEVGASEGLDVTVEVSPMFGSDLTRLTLRAEAGSDQWDPIPTNNTVDVSIAVTYPDAQFTDVAPGHLFEQEIWWGAWSGVTLGFGDGSFGVSRDVSRLAAMAWLWRLAGSPVVECPEPFSDVSEGSQFYEAVCWAAATDVSLGFADGTFRPWDSVTRQAFVAWLWRLAGSPVVACPVEFPDVPEEHLLRDAVCWAAATGVTTGFGDGSFGPALRLTRGQAMAFLFRSSEHVGPLLPA